MSGDVQKIEDETLSGVGRVFARIAGLLRFVSIFICIPAILVTVSTDVISRTFWNAPILGANEISSSLLVIVFVGCLPFASLYGRHIRMDLVSTRFRGPTRRIAAIISAFCGVFMFGALTYEAYHRVQDIVRYDEVSQLLELPLWPTALYLGACALLVTIIEIWRGLTGNVSSSREG